MITIERVAYMRQSSIPETRTDWDMQMYTIDPRPTPDCRKLHHKNQTMAKTIYTFKAQSGLTNRPMYADPLPSIAKVYP